MAAFSPSVMHQIKADEQMEMKKSLLAALGTGDIKHENFALVVVKIMVALGMNNLQKAITDMGDLQNSQAEAQGDLTSLGSLLSLIEGSVVKNGPNSPTNSGWGGSGAPGNFSSVNGLPANFWKPTVNGAINPNISQLKNAMESLFQLFSANNNTSLPTASSLCIEIDGYKVYADGHGNAPLSIRNVLKNYLQDVIGKIPCLKGGLAPNAAGLKHYSLAVVYAVNKLQQSLMGTNPNLVLKKIKAGGEKALLSFYNPSNDNTVSTGLAGLWGKINSPVSYPTPPNVNAYFTGNYSSYSDSRAYSGNDGSLWENLKNSIANSGADYNWNKWETSVGYYGSVTGIFNLLACQYYNQNQPGSASNGQVGHGSILSEMYNSVSNSQSLFSTQTTRNNASLQQYSSQLTSFDQIGQNIVSAESKFQDFVVQGSK